MTPASRLRIAYPRRVPYSVYAAARASAYWGIALFRVLNPGIVLDWTSCGLIHGQCMHIPTDEAENSFLQISGNR